MSSTNDEKPFILVAAIDFGTTYSGYGFSFTTSKNEIKMPTNWGASMGHQSYKTPTSVLVNDAGKLLAFGYDAQKKYSDAVGAEDEGDPDDEESEKTEKVNEMHFFKHFKMDLHGKEKLDKSVKVKATDGFELPALDVFAMALNFLRGHLVDTVNNQQVCTLEPNQIRWVLTVPAIWSEVAKTFMKEAAVQGELVDTTTSTNLIIALEPESASLYCRTKDIAQFVDGDSVHSQKQEKGDKYMVVDAGGGTMDITVHEIVEHDKVKELDRASGGPWGGIYVDEQLEQLYDEVFGKEPMSKFRAKHPNHWITMMLDWEGRKKGTKPAEKEEKKDKKPATVNLGISAFFSDFLQEETHKTITELVKAKSGCGMTFAAGFVKITQAKINEMFAKVLDPTMQHLHKLLANPKLSNLKCIFIVGGFGESKFLQQRIKDEFETPTRMVLAPIDASLCVIKGAILFGHSPNAISSRIAPRTFCLRTTMAVKRAKEKGMKYKKSQLTENGTRLRYLKPLVTMGEEIGENRVESITTKPVSAKSTSVKFQFVTANTREVCDPEAEGVHVLGDIIVDVDPKLGLNSNEIELQMIFGGTSVQVKALHKKSKKIEEAAFNRPEA